MTREKIIAMWNRHLYQRCKTRDFTASTFQYIFGKSLQQYNTKNYVSTLPTLWSIKLPHGWPVTSISTSHIYQYSGKYKKQYSPWLEAIMTTSSRLQRHKILPSCYSHWLPCATDRFLCMFIGPRVLQFIIYSQCLLIIPHLCIYQSHMLLDDETSLSILIKHCSILL